MNGPVYGTRIPKDYFVRTGFGETDLGSGIDPWETGSYDLALLEAGIDNFNILKYTSVLPPQSQESPYDDLKTYLHHGAALETIMAQINGKQGDQLTAGVGRIQVRRKSDGVHIGGFAAEYEGHAPEEQAKQILEKSLKGIFERRYKDDEYEHFDLKFDIVANVVEKKWATAIACIGFVTYVYPEYDDR